MTTRGRGSLTGVSMPCFVILVNFPFLPELSSTRESPNHSRVPVFAWGRNLGCWGFSSLRLSCTLHQQSRCPKTGQSLKC